MKSDEVEPKRCFQCNQKINSQNTIYQICDASVCSTSCRDVRYNLVSTIDPNFTNPECWPTIKNYLDVINKPVYTTFSQPSVVVDIKISTNIKNIIQILSILKYINLIYRIPKHYLFGIYCYITFYVVR